MTPPPAGAQALRLTVIGAGAGVACAEWAAAGRSDPELEQWAFGFAGAIAAAAQMRQGGDPLASMDADAIHAWLGDRCRDRPDEALSVALIRMVVATTRRHRLSQLTMRLTTHIEAARIVKAGAPKRVSGAHRARCANCADHRWRGPQGVRNSQAGMT